MMNDEQLLNEVLKLAASLARRFAAAVGVAILQMERVIAVNGGAPR